MNCYWAWQWPLTSLRSWDTSLAWAVSRVSGSREYSEVEPSFLPLLYRVWAAADHKQTSKHTRRCLNNSTGTEANSTRAWVDVQTQHQQMRFKLNTSRRGWNSTPADEVQTQHQQTRFKLKTSRRGSHSTRAWVDEEGRGPCRPAGDP